MFKRISLITLLFVAAQTQTVPVIDQLNYTMDYAMQPKGWLPFIIGGGLGGYLEVKYEISQGNTVFKNDDPHSLGVFAGGVSFVVLALCAGLNKLAPQMRSAVLALPVVFFSWMSYGARNKDKSEGIKEGARLGTGMVLGGLAGTGITMGIEYLLANRSATSNSTI